MKIGREQLKREEELDALLKSFKLGEVTLSKKFVLVHYLAFTPEMIEKSNRLWAEERGEK